mgnify:CR=1 FL=1
MFKRAILNTATRCSMRRVPRQPSRLLASHDESVPSLAVLQGWNNKLLGLVINVVVVEGKGLGVVARITLPAGAVVAEYNYRVVNRARCPPGDYRVDVAGKPRSVGKIDRHTFGPPNSGVARVGALLNEPSADTTPNCVRVDVGRNPSAPGGRASRGTFHLVTTRHVCPGEELTWNYGTTYGTRAY